MDLEAGAPHLVTGLFKDSVQVMLVGSDGANVRQEPGTANLSFIADEVDELHSACRDAAVEVIVEPGDRDDGQRDFAIRDQMGTYWCSGVLRDYRVGVPLLLASRRVRTGWRRGEAPIRGASERQRRTQAYGRVTYWRTKSICSAVTGEVKWVGMCWRRWAMVWTKLPGAARSWRMSQAPTTMPVRP